MRDLRNKKAAASCHGTAGFQPTVTENYPTTEAPHFANLLLHSTQLSAFDLQLIPTTLPLTTQRVTEHLLAEPLRQHARLGIDNATGEVRALASVDRPEHAATTPRSSGSTLKPFVYLAAIERHLITAATLLPDTPDAIHRTYADYDPQTYNQRSYGPVRARAALGNSLNVPAVPAVHVVSLLGARPAFNALRDWGFQFSKNSTPTEPASSAGKPTSASFPSARAPTS